MQLGWEACQGFSQVCARLVRRVPLTLMLDAARCLHAFPARQEAVSLHLADFMSTAGAWWYSRREMTVKDYKDMKEKELNNGRLASKPSSS
jgi:hypothetical protein